MSEIDFGEWKRKRGIERRKNGSSKKIQEVHPLSKKKKKKKSMAMWQMINELG